MSRSLKTAANVAAAACPCGRTTAKGQSVAYSACCGCECARERAELARIDRARKAETEALKRQALREALRDAVVEQYRAEHEAGVEAIADRIERRMGGVA